MGILSKARPAELAPTVSVRHAPEMHPELIAAMAAVSADLDARKAIDQAIERNVGELGQAEEQSRAADMALAALEVDLAVETDISKVAALEAKANAARAAQLDATIKVQRVARMRQAFGVKARETDERLKHDRAALTREVQGQAQVVFSELSFGLREAAEPLVAHLRKVHAAATAFGLHAALVQLLDSFAVPSLIANEPPIIAGYFVRGPSAERVDLSSAWRDDPEACAIVETMQAYAELRQRLAQHQDYREPPPARPYTPRNPPSWVGQIGGAG
ncbi:hypothetical protein [Acidisoma cladoniae]|uniref:hypothetical protein n=1 Tax=Acidisoma cladoniae TaxID=3040935 RepID=UPI00254F26F7|nr:hypothetical protein [Acidisoma sp. PAMC 29798]